MDTVCCYAASFVCDYAFSPRVMFTHFVYVGLLYSLVRQNVNVVQFVQIAVKLEILQLLLWLFLPFENLGTLAVLWYSLKTYEQAVGLKVELLDSTAFLSDVDLSPWLKRFQASSALKGLVMTLDDGGRQRLDTPLQCARRGGSSKSDSEFGEESTYFIDLGDVSAIRSSCDIKMMFGLRQHDVKADRCFTVEFGAGRSRQEVVLVADSSETRDQWLHVLQLICGTDTQDTTMKWLKKLVSIEWRTEGVDASARHFGVDEAYSVLLKAKRNADRNYIVELFKGLAKAAADPGTKSRSSSDAKLSLVEFASLFKETAITNNVIAIFSRLQDPISRKACIGPKAFYNFIVSQQKEQITIEAVLQWIFENEPVMDFGYLSVAGFANYILDDDNSVFNTRHRVIYQDMHQPLSHYFIATSHNTYLTKDQLRSKSSVDAYINALKRGCKCVELDTWDGPNNEPIIYHGHTLTSKILFKDVIKAIKDYAFCVSRYPVILSFENHCSVEQQKVMATHLTNILGDILHAGEIPEDETCLPSPEALQGYVIVKAKKRRAEQDDFDDIDDDFSDDDVTEEELHSFVSSKKNTDDMADTISMNSENIEEDEGSTGGEKKRLSLMGMMDTMKNMPGVDFFKRNKKEKLKVPKIAQELSNLVTYCQATGFRSFEHSRQNCKHYEMSSFGEKKAMRFAREIPLTFLQYNQRQLSRTYPAGVRFDSSNYDPLPLWAVGCQLVALNYQTPCREMQLNQGLFQDNGGCGYVLKPEFMRKENITFDPRGPFVDVHTLTFKEIRGHQIPYKAEKVVKSERSLLVQIKTAGVDADNQVQRTTPTKNNGYNPTWEDELTFKLHVPELVLVNFAVYTKESFVAQFTMPFSSIMQGYRKIPLQNKFSEPIPNAYLLANISVQAPI